MIEQKARGLTDEQVEEEITRLLSSPLVALAKQEQRVRYRRRQYMYQLRSFERRGRELAESGITADVLNWIERDCDDGEDL